MALLGHTIVEAGLARFAGLWPQTARGNRMRLRPAPLRKPDQTALQTATALYAGEKSLSAVDFADLSWLPHFAGSGRQLLMCHALNLLEGWSSQRHGRRSLQQEADIVLRLARSAGAFAAVLDETAIEPLSQALHSRIQALLAMRTSDPNELLIKAITLIQVSGVVADNASLTKEATKLLNLALPSLVNLDGGPILHQIRDYMRWISVLLDANFINLNPAGRNALDRARPFLSMLIQHDLTYCFNHAELIQPTILATTPMRLAPISGVARMSEGKSVVISLPQHINGQASFNISGHSHWILNASHFQHDSTLSNEQTFLANNSSEDGSLLQQVTEGGERTVFLSPKGDDLRIEDLVAADGLKRWMQLSINPAAKLSVARNATVATIALDGRNIWQLTLRGAKILPMQEAGTLLIETNTQKDRINWALKRITRSPSRGAKPESLELPF